MRLVHEDFHWKRLILDPAGAVPDQQLSARVTVIQPQGYRQELTVSADRIQVRDAAVELAILYPMVDDGRYDPSHGTWNGAWEMGAYRFAAEVAAGGRTVAADTLEIDPSDFFPRDHRYVIAVDAAPQIIECAPRQALYTDEPEARFTARIRRHRVTRCHVSVDVTGTRRLRATRRSLAARPHPRRPGAGVPDRRMARRRVLDPPARPGRRRTGRTVLRTQVLEAGPPARPAAGGAGPGRPSGGAGRRLVLR